MRSVGEMPAASWIVSTEAGAPPDPGIESVWQPVVPSAMNGHSGRSFASREFSEGPEEPSTGCDMPMPGMDIIPDISSMPTMDAGASIGGHIDAHTASAKETEKDRSARSANRRRKRRITRPPQRPTKRGSSREIPDHTGRFHLPISESAFGAVRS